MSYQGTFTPGADPQAVPLPASGQPDEYRHGQWWTSTADGFVAGRNVYTNERIWGIAYSNLTGDTTADNIDFQPEGVDGRNTLNCNELSIRVEFSDPAQEVRTRESTMQEINLYARGFRLRRGRTTDWFDTPITTVVLECTDESGFFSRNALDADPFLRRGAKCEIDATWRGDLFPLFRGKLVTLIESTQPDNYTIYLSMQDDTYDLAAPIRGKYNAGDAYDDVPTRIQKVLDKGPNTYPQTRFDPSDVTLTNYATQRTLLDEIALSCMSSGCAFFFDNDGVPTMLNERRLAGRDGYSGLFSDACSPNTPNMSYNEIGTAWADHEFANNVIVNNVSQGNEASVERVATDQNSIDTYGVQTWAPPQLAICNVEHLVGLAAFELVRRKDAYYRVTRMRFNPMNNDRGFFAGLSFQIGTAVYITRTPSASEQALIDVYVIEGIDIAATGTSWSFEIFVSPAVYAGDRKFGDFDFGEFEFGGVYDVTA